MKKKIIGLFLLVGCQVTAQVSVFDCNVFTRNLSQAELNTDTLFYGTCVEIGGTPITLNNSNHTTIKASEQIQLKNGVKIGGFDNIGSAQFSIETRSDTDVTVINYETLDAVLRYKKLEFGVPLASEIENRIMSFINKTGEDSLWLNPFLEWDIDVEASFYHPESGWYKIIDGFYTREYEQNPSTSDWDDKGTDYPFRIRYAPPQNGLWRSQIVIKIKGQTVYSSGFFNFSVIESGDPGYVHTHENKTNLKRGGRMIFPIGHNSSTPDYLVAYGGNDDYPGENLYSSDNPEKASNIFIWNEHLESISDYLQKGGSFLRTIQSPWMSLIEFEEKGNYYKRLHYAKETDKLLDTLEKYDGLLCFNLLTHSPMMHYSDYDMTRWDWEAIDSSGQEETRDWLLNKYCYNDKPFGQKQAYEMFLDENDLAYHKQRTRYYIARYGYSTKIYSFELLSEPFHLGEHNRYGPGGTSSKQPFSNSNDSDHINVRNAVENYHKVISKYLKDSLRVSQLVGINMGSGENLDVKSPRLKSIDFIGVNFYYTAPNALYISDNIDNYVYDKLVKDNWQLHGDFIPILFSEGGTDEDHLKCSNYATYPVDLMTLPFSGVAGYNAWNGWEKENEHLRDITIRVQDHMNGEDVINTLSNTWGAWKQTREKRYLKAKVYEDKLGVSGSIAKDAESLLEMQAYISSDRSKIVGYVKNNTFNVFTNRTNDTSVCFNNDTQNTFPFNTPLNLRWEYEYTKNKNGTLTSRLKIDNLPDLTTYTIHFYSLDTHISSSEKITLNKKLRIEFPELYIEESWQNRPVVWFVAEKKNARPENTNDELDSLMIKEVQVKLLEVEGNLEENQTKIIEIYPNPFQNTLTIVSPEDDRLSIQTLLGNHLVELKVRQGKNSIPLNQLPQGVYLLYFKKQNIHFKIIKQ